MYGICGWFGAVGDTATSEAVLDAMLADCGRPKGHGGVCVGVGIGQVGALAPAPAGGGEPPRIWCSRTKRS